MRRPAWLGGFLAAAAQLASVGLLLTSGWLIVRAAQHPPVLYLMVAIVGVRFFGIGRAALRYAERLVTHDDALARAIDDRVVAYRSLRRAGVTVLTGRRSGDVVRRVVSDVERIQDGRLRIRIPWVAALVTWPVVTAVVAVVEPWAGVAVGVQGLLTLVVLRLVVHRTVDVGEGEERGRLAADLTEVVRAAPDLVALGVAPDHLGSARSAIADLARSDRRVAWAEGLGQLVVLVLGSLSVLACLLLATLPGPALAAVVALAPLAVLDVLLGVAEAERLRPSVEASRRRLDALHALSAPVPTPDRASAVAGFVLEAQDLAVGWSDERPVVTGLDLRVEEGEVVAVTAPSGGGKTTLALTALRQLPARGGRLLLGGVPVQDLTPELVQERVGLLGQDEVVLDTTLRENLRVGRPDASEADLIGALVAAGLGPLVRSSEAALDLEVGERGARLSGGERQRLALARLLLAGHRVLVLDEPTEHLDAASADRLLDDVLALAPRCSVVILTHSPAVLARVDRVVALDAAPAVPRETSRVTRVSV